MVKYLAVCHKEGSQVRLVKNLPLKDPYCPRVKECSTQIPNAAFVSVPDLGHADTFFRSDLILPEVKQFLDNLQA